MSLLKRGNRNQWTREETKFMKDFYDKLSINDMRLTLDRSKSAIQHRAHALKLTRYKQPVRNKKKRDNHNPLTISMAMFLNATHVEVERTVNLQDLLEIVSRYFFVQPVNIISLSRKSRVVRARHFFCYLGYNELGNSLMDIGAAIGNRDHTTVIHGRNSIATQLSLKTPNSYKEDYQQLLRLL